MKFFPLMLVAYFVGLIALRMNGHDAAWTSTQLIWLNGGAALLSVVLGYFVLVNGLRSLPSGLRTSAVMTILVVGTLSYGQRFEILNKISSVISLSAPIAAVADTAGTANVRRHWDGHFRTAASVNGSAVEMLVDTGASLVLLTYEDALIAGLDVGGLTFNVPILTANGKSHVATTTLKNVSIGGVTVDGVKAAVAEHGQLHASLLGMSFIGEIEEAVIRKDRMIFKN